VYDQSGKLVRLLAQGKKGVPGAAEAKWDGLDDEGQPAPVGKYVLKGTVANLGAEYLLLAGTGKPPWMTPDGRGAWGGIWGDVMGAAVDDQGMVYLVWWEEEGEGALLKFKPSGGEGDFVQWKQHKDWTWGKAIGVAVDDKYVYVLLARGPRQETIPNAFLRLHREDGTFAFYGNKKIIPVGRDYKSKELWPEGLEYTERDQYTQKADLNSWMYQHPEGMVAPPSVQFWSNARGIAVHGGMVYVTLYLEDKIAVYNAETGDFVKDITGITKPEGIAADSAGNLYVATEKQIVKVSPAGEAGGPTAPGLVAPYGVTVDGTGRMYVTDLGTAQQIKTFDATGKLLATAGKAGGRPWGGAWAPHRNDFLFPTQPGVSADGKLFYCGENSMPRRVLEMAGGKITQEWFGPLPAACNMMAAADPEDPSVVYHCMGTPTGGNVVRYRFDYAGRKWAMDGSWTFGDVGDPLHPDSPAVTYARDCFVRHLGGKTFVIVDTPFTFYRVDGEQLTPCAVVANANDSWYVAYLAKQAGVDMAANNNMYPPFTWRDINGDGKIQKDELDTTLSDEGYQALATLGKGANTLGPAYSGFWVDEKMNLYFPDSRRMWEKPAAGQMQMGTGTVWKVPCEGLDARGNPLYSWSKATAMTPLGAAALPGSKLNMGLKELPIGRIQNNDDKRPVMEAPDAAYTDEQGNMYCVYSQMGVRDIGINWAANNPYARVARFEPDGTLRWLIGKKAKSIARPGEMYVPHTIAGITKGCVCVVDRNAQLRVFDQDTGLYLGSLLKDIYIGPMPDEYTLILTMEWTCSWVGTDPKTKETYLIAGDYNGPRAYRMTGLEKVARFSVPFALKEPAAPPAETAAVATTTLDTTPLTIPPAPAGMVIDGKLGAWKEADRLGPVTMDPTNAEMVARKAAWFWLAWDKDNLYFAAQVNSPTALYNTARQGRNQWYFFDSVQLRTYFPEVGQQVTHWGFYQDSASGKDYISYVYGPNPGYGHEGENPAGSKLVMLKNADGRGYTLEAALPWATMGPIPEGKPGLTMKVAVQFNWTNALKTEAMFPDSQMSFRGAMNFRTPADWTVAKLVGPTP
jgi:sugar lactone lactonase YvrE